MKNSICLSSIDTIPATIRRRKEDNVPELFFIEKFVGGRQFTCYAHIGQHTTASIEYFEQDTIECNPFDPDCYALITEWNSIPNGLSNTPLKIRLVKTYTELEDYA